MGGGTVDSMWRTMLLDERQQKEIKFAELYAQDFNHGTTGHNQLLLVARLAELLDAATGVRALPKPPEPANVVLTFGKWSGKALGELCYLDMDYVEWLAREARDPAIKYAAQQVLLIPIDDLMPDESNDESTF